MERRPHYVSPPLPLFAQQHSPTSKAAADAMKLHAAGLRGRVLSYIDSRGAEGATDEEVAEALGLNPSTARPRRIELAARGLIVQAGTRRTKSKRLAVVWCVTSCVTKGGNNGRA